MGVLVREWAVRRASRPKGPRSAMAPSLRGLCIYIYIYIERERDREREREMCIYIYIYIYLYLCPGHDTIEMKTPGAVRISHRHK